MSLFYLWVLIVVVPGLHTFGMISLTILGLVIFLLVMFISIEEPGYNPKEPKLQYFFRIFPTKTLVSLLIIFTCLTVLLPDKKSVAVLVSAKYVTNIDGIDVLPENIIRYLNEYLNDEN